MTLYPCALYALSAARSRPRHAEMAEPPGGVLGVQPYQESVGGVLLSHTLASAVPSALSGLASGFGMGPGVSPTLSPPTSLFPHTCVDIIQTQPTGPPPQNGGRGGCLFRVT